MNINTEAVKAEKDAKEARDAFTEVRNQLRGINGFYWGEEEEGEEEGRPYRWEVEFGGGVDDRPSNLLSTIMELLLDEDESLFILAFDPWHDY
tara:strand:+ start:9296 stop:9574 length:279 start_codon:yes stop_codon:yes gene_type:complete